ncbi:septal ring lytic transglycosylase RlpA family protein [Kaistia defluvii]
MMGAPLIVLVALALMLILGKLTAAHAGPRCANASWYAYTGARTASGERYDGTGMTAAHRSLPFGSRVRVTNLGNGKAVVVRINDRGPFVRGRMIDVSAAAAHQLGMRQAGTACVRITVDRHSRSPP